MKAVVLLSGGIDSAVCAALAKEAGYNLYCLTFNYCQQHSAEIAAARYLCRVIGASEHKVLEIPTLAPLNPEAPYVPARNTIFLSYAVGYAETVGASAVFYGPSAEDSAFPDCSLQYLYCWQSLATKATKLPVSINAPLLRMRKADIIREAVRLFIPLSETLTCYRGTNCGSCSACITRVKGFHAAGLIDPLVYRKEVII